MRTEAEDMVPLTTLGWKQAAARNPAVTAEGDRRSKAARAIAPSAMKER